MSLEQYWKKRDFGATPEPRGKVKKGRPGFSYLVQKHAASRLHYDFRLELDGALLSWAVPKGPSLDPADKRMAIQTEDHPLEYGDFEGVIPKGEYGGGTVVLWDRGTWEPVKDPRQGLKQGKLEFVLHGEKLRGGFVLVRTKGGGGDRPAWLLIKRTDEQVRKGSKITEEEPLSVTTGRSIEEVAAEADRVWHSNREATKGSRGKRLKAKIRALAHDPKEKKKEAARRVRAGSAKAPPPVGQIQAELATLVSEAPVGEAWLHEIKLDGFRILARIADGTVTLITRNGKDWTQAFGSIARALLALPVENAILDGEVVALDEEGRSSFQLLQNAARNDQLVYFAFDLLWLDGVDVRGETLDERKARLAPLLKGEPAGPRVRYSDHVIGKGAELFAHACKLGVEGIVSKRRASVYRPGRGKDWLKVKCTKRQEFVIGGWTEPSGSRVGLGALVLGVYEPDGKLAYVGKVGTGFTGKVLKDLLARLTPTERDTPPFANTPKGAEVRGVHWVEPKLVAEVEYLEMTSDGILRHPSFQGLREDKAAKEVRREVPADAPEEDAPKKVKVLGPRGKHGAPIEVAGVKITNPERVLYPDVGITKLRIVEHYLAVAERMLPHLVDRPLTLVRNPEGWQKPGFFQKHPGKGSPPNVRIVPIREEQGKRPYLVVDDLQGLLAVVNMGALELHVWGSRADDYERPDVIVMDLDPDPSVGWERLAAAAREVRERFTKMKLESFVKTTGGKGLHVVVPFQRRADWEGIKAFTNAIADAMVRDDPRSYTATVSLAKRKGKIFVDYLRNARGATAIAPWSTRARAGAPVAVPLDWKELSAKEPPDFSIENAAARAKLRKDPWADFERARGEQAITMDVVRTLLK